ncbi:uncharacterized protein MELLADRAFT_104858 [Melampsora larici-populina 98AG31]|uniref:Secreted protein n=1 Tax=Melampsora larici-populina (strain 98AG31 / pathotype 3-4-7) TaxID=747676 RepID=F4RFZ9_MELLP|nr:uncharacterized protein MELLADRAFT_104858 [Melampsora larici-populina 98AG31]EGG08676.1 secreted protein [Melampsora larici-populina 98AG31]
MKPLILGLYVSLACHVHSRLTRYSGAGTSWNVPAVTDSSATVSGVEWSRGLEEMRQRIQQGQAYELSYNRRGGQMAVRRVLRDRKELQEAVMQAPTQPRMDRKEYSDEELRRVAEGVHGLRAGGHYEYMGDGVYERIGKSCCDVTGYCGQIRVYDSEDRGHLLYSTCCCYCDGALSTKVDRRRVPLTCGEIAVTSAMFSPVIGCLCWYYYQNPKSFSSGSRS